NDGMVLDWVPATVMSTARSTMVPRALVDHDLRVREEWAPPVFDASRDGLAAGNTHAEAVLHGLLEVVGRDCVARAHAAGAAPRLDTSSVDGDDARRLLDRFAAAGVAVRIHDVTGPTEVPAFEVTLVAPGAAARERLARISGARDDLPLDPAAAVAAPALADAPAVRDWRDVPTLAS